MNYSKKPIEVYSLIGFYNYSVRKIEEVDYVPKIIGVKREHSYLCKKEAKRGVICPQIVPNVVK